MATILRRTSPEMSQISASHNALCRRIGADAKFHIDASEVVVVGADCTNTATGIVLVNECKRVYNGVTGGWVGHRLDDLAHVATDATNAITYADATSLATAYLLANQLKSKFNTHLSQSGKHYNNDSTNTVDSVDADSEGKLVTLVNEIKADLNAHMADAPTEAAMIRLVSA